MDTTKYLTLYEAAELTRLSIRTLQRKIKDGLLPAYKPSQNLLIDPKELELFVRSSKK